MKYFILIFVFITSCSTKNEKDLIIYFDDGDLRDGPSGFPQFAIIEDRQPDMIYQFQDVEIDDFIFSKLVKGIESAPPKTEEFLSDFHKVECVYLIFPDSTKNCFFNSSCNFYNADNEFLFHNIQLAETIKRLINYDEVLKTGLPDHIPPVLYYKVVARTKGAER